MGAKIAKRYSCHKSLLNFLLLNVCLQYPHKVTFSDFLNFYIMNFNDFVFIFLNMGPYGRNLREKMSKCVCLTFTSTMLG